MKREILCRDCSMRNFPHRPASATVTLLEAAEMAAEHQKRVVGKLLHSCVCDRCDRPLNPGDEVEAATSWSDLGGIQYSPWESDYLEEFRS